MPPERRNITFEDTLDVFIQSSESSNKDEGSNDKSNYSTISSGDGENFPSNYSTVTSMTRDTVVLLHTEHRKFEKTIERQNRGRSLKGTFCFISTIVILLVLIGLAIASLHHKLSGSKDNKNNNTTLSVNAAQLVSAKTERLDHQIKFSAGTIDDQLIHKANSTKYLHEENKNEGNL